MDFDPQVVIAALPALLEGVRYTVIIAVFGMLGGTAIGFACGSLAAWAGRVPRRIVRVYVWMFRGTPLLVQALFIYFALPSLVAIDMTALGAAVLTLALNAGAYVSEIVRGAILSVDRRLVESGLALGLGRTRVLRLIVLPIAWSRMIPALGNQLIIGLKDTSLFLVIGVGELTRQGQEIVAATFRALEVWGTVAVLYLLLTTVLAAGLRHLERRLPRW